MWSWFASRLLYSTGGEGSTVDGDRTDSGRAFIEDDRVTVGRWMNICATDVTEGVAPAAEEPVSGEPPEGSPDSISASDSGSPGSSGPSSGIVEVDEAESV